MHIQDKLVHSHAALFNQLQKCTQEIAFVIEDDSIRFIGMLIRLRRCVATPERSFLFGNRIGFPQGESRVRVSEADIDPACDYITRSTHGADC